VTARRYVEVEGVLEPPVRPADRTALLGLLSGTVKVLEAQTSPVGGAYRRDLVARIKEVLRAEPAADLPRTPARDAIVLDGRAQCAAFSEVLLAPWSESVNVRPRR
jgi:hypothetical protein